MALVKMGAYENLVNNQKKACVGDTIFIPAGTWHNIINIQNAPLKLSSIYASSGNAYLALYLANCSAKATLSYNSPVFKAFKYSCASNLPSAT